MDKYRLILPASILLGCVILGSFYYASEVNKQASIERQQVAEDFDLQTKCAAAANVFYTKYGDAENRVQDGYISHWNETLGRCFIEFSSGIGSGSPTVFQEVADAVEGTEYAEIEFVAPNEDNPKWCTLYPSGNGAGLETTTSCKSKTEFDNFVGSYMND